MKRSRLFLDAVAAGGIAFGLFFVHSLAFIAESLIRLVKIPETWARVTLVVIVIGAVLFPLVALFLIFSFLCYAWQHHAWRTGHA